MTKAPWQFKYIVVQINGVPVVLPANTTQAFPGRDIRFVLATDDFAEAHLALFDAENWQKRDAA